MEINEIIIAALDDDNTTVADLLSRGADVNTKFIGSTLLHIACRRGNRDLVEILLKHGQKAQPLDFKAKTKFHGDDMVAWQIAGANGHFDLACKVLDAEHPEIAADPEIRAATPRAWRSPLRPKRPTP